MSAVEFEKIAVFTAFFSSIVFVLGYSLIAPWWRQEVGRAMVSLDCGLMLALAPAVLRMLFHVTNWLTFFAWYYGGSLLLVAGITLWRLLVIWHVQIDAVQQRLREEAQESNNFSV